MKLKANFIGDWIEMLKDMLSNHWGYDISGISDEDIPLTYFNVEHRRIEPVKREVKLSDIFVCPLDLKNGWETLKGNIEDGQDITPYLSKKIDDPLFKDSMLLDWGVHHFHLVENPRNDNILFALVTKDCFYAINVYTHNDWAKDDIVETIHRNWPEAIERYRIDAIDTTNNVTGKERSILRNGDINTFVKVSDGTIYAPIGGGFTLSGSSAQATMRMIEQKSFLKKLQSHLDSHFQLSDSQAELKKQGYNGEPEIEAKLIITEDRYIALFPAYKLAVRLFPHS